MTVRRYGFKTIDRVFGTALAPSLTDTVTDIISNVIGPLTAALLLNIGLPEQIKRRRAQEKNNGLG